MKRSVRFILVFLIAYCLVCSRAGAEYSSVRLLVGKREIPVSPAAVTDGARVLVPLAALKSLGINHAASADGKSVTVIGPAQATADIELVNVDRAVLVPLHQVLEVVGGDVTVDLAARAASIRAKLTAVEFADGLLKANCTMPVVCAISTWSGKLLVDVPGAKLATETKEVYVGGEVVAKVRLGQYNEDTARIVLDLAKPAGHKIESPLPSPQLLIRVGEQLPPASQPTAPKPVPVSQPFDITAIRVEPVNDTSFELVVDTSCRGAVSVTRSVQPSEITLFFKGGTLAESVSEVTGTHPLLVNARLAQGSTSPALARVHLNLTRPVLSAIRVEDNAVTLSVRLPDKAGGRLADKLIVIDPGHGGSQAGARWGNIKEKDVNNRISDELASALRKAGARVIYTRDSDVLLGLAPRPAVAVENKADFFISIHCNSNIKPDSVSGIETYYYRSGDSSPLLAQMIQKAVCKTTGMRDRGARDCGFKVLRLLEKTGIPGVLIECGYLNHSHDRAKLLSADYRRKLAEGIVAGLRAYVEGPQ